MRICFIAAVPPPMTGQSVASQALLDNLVDHGHYIDKINLSKVTFKQGFTSIGRLFEILHIAFRVLVVSSKADVVYFTISESVAGNLKDIILLSLLGKQRKKTWLHLHGGAGMRALLSNRQSFIAKLNGYYLRQVAGVIVLGERLAPIFNGYLSPERIQIVKNFADDQLFLSDNEIVLKWTNVKILRVLFLSNLLPGKGHIELLSAIEKIHREYPNRFRFDFAGGFESDADREIFLNSIAAQPSITYHGVVKGEAKKKLFAQAHVFCLPTFYPYEGQPISILEAYASGCAVLTTDHSGIFDIFAPGKNGLEVRPRDPESILEALLSLITHPNQGTAFALQNSVDAVSLYTKNSHLQQMYKVLGLNG